MLARDKVIEVCEALKDAGIFDRLEADWLVALVIGVSKLSELQNRVLTIEEISKIDKALDERIKGKPLAYIVGNAEFFGRNFIVNENVLIPRPETELLVENVIKDIQTSSENVKLLDLCSGSGAIGITIALETNAKVTALDISLGAIKVATDNARNLKANLEIIRSDLFSNVYDKFNYIVSNPPYIKSEDMKSLDKEVKNFEPHLALDGGESGLEFYERIIKDAPLYLLPNGKIFFEIGIGQADDIVKLMAKDFEDIRVIKDYNKIDRIVFGKLRK